MIRRRAWATALATALRDDGGTTSCNDWSLRAAPDDADEDVDEDEDKGEVEVEEAAEVDMVEVERNFCWNILSFSLSFARTWFHHIAERNRVSCSPMS